MHFTRIHVKRLAGMALALSFLGGDCDAGDPIFQDGSFRLWGDDGLSAWKIEEGSIRQAPTWSASDPGVELLGPKTTMSQNLATSPKCAVLTIVARVDGDATLTVSGGTNHRVFAPHGVFQTYNAEVGFVTEIGPDGAIMRTPKLSMTRSGTGSVVIATIEGVGGVGCAEDAQSVRVYHDEDGGTRTLLQQ